MVEDKATEAKAKPAAEPVESKAEEPERISFKEFLEDVPPSQSREVNRVWVPNSSIGGIETAQPELQLHCVNEICNGIRVFRTRDDFYLAHDEWQSGYIEFICSNCFEETKTYSLAILALRTKDYAATCFKYGEMPAFGPPTPPRLIKLIGPDRDVFLKGRKCELQGLGIGAFGYYRRIVEDHKNRIFDAIIKAAGTLAAPKEMISALNAAKEENQFQKAIESIKPAVPDGLLINGYNPLTLLHSALSEGLHAKTDEECLQSAHDIRVVLAALSERLAEAVRDEKELKDAVNRLAQKK